MHRDHKLAFSLGLLLIGVAAALCFPRQPQTDLAGLELEDADRLDAAIDLLPVRVYTETHGRPDAEVPDEGPATTETPETKPVLRDPFAEFALLSAAPEPIPLADVTRPATARPAPVETPPLPSVRDEDDRSRAEDTPVVSRQDPAADEAHEPVIYEVRPGDTLSELAARFLGSSRRFLELYEANRHVLSSADDLRVGMRLIIPRPEGDAGGLPTGDLRTESEPRGASDRGAPRSNPALRLRAARDLFATSSTPQ